MFAAPDLVTFGEAFDVVAAHGEAPHVRPDSVVVTVSTVCWADQHRLVAGREHGKRHAVRFTEKDTSHGVKDVLIWLNGLDRQRNSHSLPEFPVPADPRLQVRGLASVSLRCNWRLHHGGPPLRDPFRQASTTTLPDSKTAVSKSGERWGLPR